MDDPAPRKRRSEAVLACADCPIRGFGLFLPRPAAMVGIPTTQKLTRREGRPSHGGVRRGGSRHQGRLRGPDVPLACVRRWRMAFLRSRPNRPRLRRPLLVRCRLLPGPWARIAQPKCRLARFLPRDDAGPRSPPVTHRRRSRIRLRGIRPAKAIRPRTLSDRMICRPRSAGRLNSLRNWNLRRTRGQGLRVRHVGLTIDDFDANPAPCDCRAWPIVQNQPDPESPALRLQRIIEQARSPSVYYKLRERRCPRLEIERQGFEIRSPRRGGRIGCANFRIRRVTDWKRSSGWPDPRPMVWDLGRRLKRGVLRENRSFGEEVGGKTDTPTQRPFSSV